MDVWLVVFVFAIGYILGLIMGALVVAANSRSGYVPRGSMSAPSPPPRKP